MFTLSVCSARERATSGGGGERARGAAGEDLGEQAPGGGGTGACQGAGHAVPERPHRPDPLQQAQPGHRQGIICLHLSEFSN